MDKTNLLIEACRHTIFVLRQHPQIDDGYLLRFVENAYNANVSMLDRLKMGEYVMATTVEEQTLLDKLWDEDKLIFRLSTGSYRLTAPNILDPVDNAVKTTLALPPPQPQWEFPK